MRPTPIRRYLLVRLDKLARQDPLVLRGHQVQVVRLAQQAALEQLVLLVLRGHQGRPDHKAQLAVLDRQALQDQLAQALLVQPDLPDRVDPQDPADLPDRVDLLDHQAHLAVNTHGRVLGQLLLLIP